MLKNTLIVFLLFLLCNRLNEQNYEIDEFTISNDSDTIEFVRISSGFTEPKQTLLFCQGSLPIPLVIESNNGPYLTSIGNFNYESIIDDYYNHFHAEWRSFSNPSINEFTSLDIF